jgi:tetratricopeptide (TPR) repeat protein
MAILNDEEIGRLLESAKISFSQDHIDEALGLLKQLEGIDRLGGEVAFLKGVALFNLGKIEALDALKEAVRIEPHDALYLVALSQAQSSFGDHVGALSSIETACSMQPEVPSLIFQKAMCLRSLGRLDEAERAFFRAYALQPDLENLSDEIVRTMVALALRQIEKGEAEAAYKLLIQSTAYSYGDTKLQINLLRGTAYQQAIDRAIDEGFAAWASGELDVLGIVREKLRYLPWYEDFCGNRLVFLEALSETPLLRCDLNGADSDIRLAAARIHTIKSVCAISQQGRSGSYLLASLLDGHPTLLSMHPLNHIQSYYAHTKCSLDDADETTYERVLFFFGLHLAEARQTIGEARADRYGQLFLSLLKLHAASGLEMSLRAYAFRALYVAYAGIYEVDVPDEAIIVYSIHNHFVEYFIKLARDFDSVFHLHAVREPEIALASQIRNNIQDNSPVWREEQILKILSSYFEITGPPIVQPNVSHASVRFEDMHYNTEVLMRKVSHFLSREFQPCFLKSTFFGEPYTFRRGKEGSEAVSGVGHAKVLGRQTAWMSALDAFRLKIVMAETFEKWDYHVPPVLSIKLLRWILLVLTLPLELRAETGLRHRLQDFDIKKYRSARLKLRLLMLRELRDHQAGRRSPIPLL